MRNYKTPTCQDCGASCSAASVRCFACQQVVKAKAMGSAICSGCGGPKGTRARLCRSCNNAKIAAGRKLDQKWLVCPDCGGAKTAGAARCQPCYFKTRRQGEASPARRYNLMYRYGITVEQFDEMSAAQGGACLLCRVVPAVGLVVDHCHAIGDFRGLLCHNCNTAIGLAGDDPVLLRKMADYVEAASVVVS